MSTYPKRPSHFAHRFTRLLTKAAVAQEIGPDACWLLAVIAHQEDAKRYRSAVTFWNGQLMPLCGFNSEKPFARARRKAVEAGWLHYEAGGKGKAGRYWCLIPDGHDKIDDSPMDESIGLTVDIDRPNRPTNGGQTVLPVDSDGQTAVKRRSNGRTFNPIPNPIPCNAACSSDEHPQRTRWNPRFIPEEFASVGRGYFRFQEAVEHGVVRADDELRWMTLWIQIGRRAGEDGPKRPRNPGAVFRIAVESRQWDGSQDDEDAAREYLKQIRRENNGNGDALPVVAGLQDAFVCDEAQEVDDDEF